MSVFLLTGLLLAIAGAGLFLVHRWPDYIFWVVIVLLFDPTGHLTVYFGKEALGGFYYRDFLFVLAFMPFISSRVNRRGMFNFKPFLVLLGVQVLFLLYHVFVFGYWQPGKGWDYVLRYVLVRERMTVFGFLLIVPVFMMARRNLAVFVNVLVVFSLLVYLMYFISVTTSVELLPLWQAERYRGTGILRYLMFSSGLSDMLIPLSIFVFARRIDYRYRNLLFVGTILMLLAVLLSLTKSSYINVAGLVVASLFMYYRFYRSSFRGLLGMLLGPAVLMLLLMLMVFPEYPGLVWRQVSDLWLFITGDAYTSGVVEGRLVNQWPAHLALIIQRPWFGTGAGFSEFFSMRFHPSDYEVTDLPITGHLAMYGVVGLAIYSLLYIQMWRYIVTTYRIVKNRIQELNDLDVALFFVVFAWMVKSFFFKPNYLFNELTTGTLLINLYAGILAALIYRIRKT
jgi:hypothetical protein